MDKVLRWIWKWGWLPAIIILILLTWRDYM